MIYDVRHLTTYAYDMPVTFARCLMRVSPLQAAGQQVLSSGLRIAPAPISTRERYSFFGARETLATINTPHDELAIESVARVEVRRTTPADLGASAPWESVREDAYASRRIGPRSPAHFIYPSAKAPILAATTEYARISFTLGRPILEAAADLMARFHGDFEYDPSATLVTTPIEAAFSARRGVCQDFAHILISALRGLGLPAGYASGYLRTDPPPGAARLVGVDATHAWVCLWAGSQGWVGLDPTNNVFVGESHIVLATGRDYGEASPLEGVIFGAGDQDLSVEVDVTPVS